MNRFLRILKSATRYILYSAGVVVVLAVVSLLFLGFTAPGARVVATLIEKYASTPDQIVRISDPSALLTGNFQAATVTLFDSKGTYAEIRDLTVNWSPRALFSTRFEAASLAAGTVRLERLPIPSQETREVRSTFALPLAVKIDKLTVEELIVGKEIAGTDQLLTVTGNIDATNERIASALSVSQRDRPDAKALADIVFDPAANALKLEASINEPKGGMLSKLLRLPGEPAVALTVTGDGPLSKWSGSATAALDGNQVLKIDGHHDLAPDGRRSVALTGGGAFASLMPPAFRPLFEGTTDIDLSAVMDDAATVRIERGNFATGVLSLSAGGTFSTSGANDLTASLTGKDGPIDFRLPLSEGEVRLGINSANLSLIGDAGSAILDVAADLASVEHPQGRIEAVKAHAYSDAFNLSTQSGALKVSLETGATQFQSADIDRLIKGPVTVNGGLQVSPETVVFNPLTIESASVGGTLAGTYTRNENTVSTQFKIFALPATLPEALAAKFDTTIALAGNLATGAEGAVKVTDMVLKSGTVEAAGSVALETGNLTANITGNLPDLGKLLADARGSAAFTTDVTGPLDALGIKAEVTSSGATLSGRTLSDLIVSVDATASKESPEAAITATGALDGQAIDVKANVVSANGRTTVPVLEARIGDNRLNGALDFDAAFKPTGSLDFNFPDVALLAAMAGEKASGDMAGSAAIRTDANGVTSLSLKASGAGIKRGDLVITRPLADITVSDLSTLSVAGNLSVATVAQGANRLEGLKLDFTRQGPKTVVSLDGRYDNAPLRLRGDIQTTGARTQINLATLSAAPRGIALTLASPTSLTLENGTVSFRDLTVGASGGTIAVSGSAGERLDVAVRLNAVPATLINAVSPSLGAAGTIGGTVGVKGTAAAPVVSYDLRWTGAAIAQARSAGVGALDVAAKGQFANNTVTLDSTISGAGGLSFKGGGRVGITGSLPIDMRFTGDVPFALLSGLLAEQGFTLTGQASVDLAVAGAATAPRITGTIATSGVRLVDVRRNIAVTDLTANVRLDGQRATISTLTGRLASGGTVSASGSIGITPGSGFPADIAIRLANASYVDGTLFNANVDGDMTLKGSLVATPVLAGKVTIHRAAITIPEKLPASLSQIDIKHRNAPADVRRMERKVDSNSGGDGSNTTGGIGFDLTVSAPGQMFVRGRGIDAELGGDLVIRGNATRPIVSGGFEMRRGRLEILGKRLVFSDGTISFGGDLVPTLDLDATSSAGSTTITVNVAGLANNPTVSFSSSPALPQDEILAQLIFNRSLSNLSALQIAQLASAVSQLAGGGSNSLLDGLRNKLGVDDLDVTTDANGGASVTAGKYLNDRTYLELQSGTEAGSGKAIINLDVGRGVKLRGEAGSTGGGAGIFYEKEY